MHYYHRQLVYETKQNNHEPNALQWPTDSYVSAMVERFGDTEEKWIEEAKEVCAREIARFCFILTLRFLYGLP